MSNSPYDVLSSLESLRLYMPLVNMPLIKNNTESPIKTESAILKGVHAILIDVGWKQKETLQNLTR